MSSVVKIVGMCVKRRNRSIIKRRVEEIRKKAVERLDERLILVSRLCFFLSSSLLPSSEFSAAVVFHCVESVYFSIRTFSFVQLVSTRFFLDNYTLYYVSSLCNFLFIRMPTTKAFLLTITFSCFPGIFVFEIQFRTDFQFPPLLCQHNNVHGYRKNWHLV